MALVLNGSGITSANIVNGTIVDEDVADVAASKLTGALPAIDGSALTNLPGGGKVLQVIIDDHSTVQTLSSATYTDTSLSITITPTSATSTILVQWNMVAEMAVASSGYGTKLLRGATAVHTAGSLNHTFTPTSGMYMSSTQSYIDSPATTSATTYKIQAASSAGNTVYLNNGSNHSQLIVMEIGA